MMNGLVLRSAFRTSNRKPFRPVNIIQKRNFHEEEPIPGDMEKWAKITGIGLICVALAYVKVFVFGEEEEEYDTTPYPYRKIRNKSLPWGNGDLDFMENLFGEPEFKRHAREHQEHHE
eukprot:TRINITY_DN6230_c0_g1_i4.p1 TRINITY_DN6230_c0_g1~~TRINITY_DN6230_c0_g1_i4.p1  ORF type:complete len:118 (-),score=19.96 TRINITY_DN6230_c0_g1_i4:39-392(-)